MITKPSPVLTTTNAPFFQACNRGEFLLQKCGACGLVIYYPRDVCPECLSRNLRWEKTSGRGIVQTFTLVFRPESPAFFDDVPITIVVVELEEGPTMIAGFSGEQPPSIGQEVEVSFAERGQVAIPIFRPRRTP